MGRYGGNWTWYEYRAIQTMDPFVQRDPSFGRDVQSTPPQGCPLLVLCHLIPIHLYSSSCNWCRNSSCTNGGNKISHWSTAPAEWFFSMRSMMKLDVNWLKHAGWKMVRLWSPHVILSKELWHYYIIMELIFTNGPYISVSYLYMWCTNWYQLHTFWIYIYIYTYQHQSFEYTVSKVILPLAHGHPQCILRATSLNDPRSTEQAYRQKECGQGAIS